MVDPYIITRAAGDFPLRAPSRLTTSRPGLVARSVAHAAFVVGKQHVENVKAAAQYSHADIAPEVLPEARAELNKYLQDQVRALFGNPADGLQREVERALAAADKAADVYRPHLDTESPTQLLRTDQAWNNSIRPALESGKKWEEIIPTTDADGLLAIERFAAGHESRVRDRFHQHEVPAVLAGIKALTDRRTVEIAPAEGKAALAEHQDIARSLEFVSQAGGWLADADHRNALGVGLGLERAGKNIGAHRPVDTSPEAQAAYQATLVGQTAPTAVEHGLGAAAAA